MAGRPWTKDEIKLLKKRYPTEGITDELLDALPGRNKESINVKASRLALKYVGDVPVSEKNATVKQKILKYLAGGAKHTLTDICNHLEKSPAAVQKILDELKAEHYNVELLDETVSVAPESRTGGKEVLDVKKYFGSNREVAFGVISDLHYCNIHSREDLIQLMYEKMKAEGVPIVFQPGNMIDGEARFNMYEVNRVGIEGQISYLVERAPKVPGVTTYFITGDDHEGWAAKRVGLNIGKKIEHAFREAGRNDWIYMSHMEADVAFKTPKGEAIVRVVHPGGGTAYAISYTPQKIIESLQGGEKPHAYVIGHYHKLGYFSVRNVHTILAGTFEDQTTFMRKLHIEAHVGGWIIRMSLGEDGSIKRFIPECFPFFDRKVYQVNRDFPIQSNTLTPTEREMVKAVQVF